MTRWARALAHVAAVMFLAITGGGAPFTYSPFADAEGFDPAVTGVEISPTGAPAGAGAGNPSFTLRFRIRVE